MYDVYLRIKMPSYYLDLRPFKNIDDYYDSLEHSFRKYIFFELKKFRNYNNQGQLFIYDQKVDSLNEELKFFIKKIMHQKNNPWWYYYFYVCFYSMLLNSNNTHPIIVCNSNNQIICFYIDFKTTKIYYCISALIDHANSLWKNGSYFYHINQVINSSFSIHNHHFVRLGPTTDELKIKLGGKVKKLHDF